MTREKSRFMLLEVMDELFSILDEDPHYTFMLDGQTIPLADYLEIEPENKEKLAALVAAGRISIGPWYVLPDELLISGESHIRNFLEGERQCRALGGAMIFGYLPDSFGHPSQMPQILAGLGMREIVFWRGLGPDITRTEFTWQGRDGTEILGVNMPQSYGVAACMPEDPDDFVRRLKLKIDLIAPLTDGQVILLMNGVDHVAPQRSFAANLARARKKLPELQLRHTGLSEYLRALRAQDLTLQKAVGELRSGHRAYLLGGTISTRMYLKQANFRVETMLEKHAEPLATLAWVARGSGYPQAELAHAWRLLLSNLPHDSICGCGVDAIHEEMVQRYRFIEELAGSLVEKAGAVLADAAPGTDGAWDGGFGLFNPLLHPRGDIARVSLVAAEKLLRKVNFDTGALEEHEPEPPRMPTGIIVRDAAGYESEGVIHSAACEDTMHLSLHTQPEMYRGVRIDFSFCPTRLPSVGFAFYDYRLTYGSAAALPAERIENELFIVSFDRTGATLRVEDKQTGEVYEGLHALEDGADAGDEYTYSWPQHDAKVGMDPSRVTVRTEGGTLCPSLVVSGFLKAPARLSVDRRTRSTETVDIPVQSRVSLCRGTPRIDVQTVVENAAEDHRLRVLFPLGRKAEAGSSEGIFSVDDRPVTPRDKRAYADWVEPPSTNPQKTFVSVCAEARGLTVANRGLPENEVFTDEKGNAVIALTLLRSVGWLSRPDLLARSGNGGWTLPTPGAQCKGRHVFEYAIIPHRGSWEQAGAVALSHQFAFPPLAFAAGAASPAVRAPAPYSFVSVDRPEVVLSALKKAEERESCILRAWNASGHAVNAAFAFTEGVKAAYRTSLAEKRGEKLAVKNGVLAVELAPWKIVTLELVFAGNRRTGRVAPPDGTENG